MDDTQHDSRYPSKHYTAYNSSSYRSNPKRPILSQSYNEDDDNGYQNDELDEENIDNEDDDVYEDDDVEEDNQFRQNGYGRVRVFEANDKSNKRRQKKRKLDNLSSKYEFAPRVSVNLQNLQKLRNEWNEDETKLDCLSSKYEFAPRNLQKLRNEWNEDETFILLEVWGDRFLQLGRKSLRSEDWADVAEKVTEVCKVEREDIECRNRLDFLKKKYKKEKAKMEEMGGYYGKWTFFKKMDMLLNASPRQQTGLACGVDSGEYVFMNPRIYLNQSNAFDEMRDSPGESESDDEVDGDNGGDGVRPDTSSFKLVADSIQKFGEIFEKIEDSKRQQMMELEKMRMDFHRELELQKSQILERAQAEIAKIRQGDDDDDDDDDGDDNDNDNDDDGIDDASAENLSE